MKTSSRNRAEVARLHAISRSSLEPGRITVSLRSGPVELSFQRDTYFDAPDWTLRRRGVTCRFRVRVDDRRLLSVHTIGRPEAGAPLAVSWTSQAEVPELDGAQALAGASEPARQISRNSRNRLRISARRAACARRNLSTVTGF